MSPLHNRRQRADVSVTFQSHYSHPVRHDEIEALYRKYGAMVHRRALSILGDTQAAHDLVQEVFVNVLRAPGAFRNEASPVTYLYQAVTNLSLRRLRDNDRRGQLLDKNFSKTEASTENAPPDDRATLASILAHVPEDLREIAILYFVDEMSQDEIAEKLGLARRTVGNRLDAFRLAARKAAGEAT